jgi:hypothetical protein
MGRGHRPLHKNCVYGPRSPAPYVSGAIIAGFFVTQAKSHGGRNSANDSSTVRLRYRR